MPLQPGTRLAAYEIVAAIGAGGMGEVYRARDTRLHRDVAIKILPVSVSSDADRVSRFGREALAASALNHPNILHVYDVGEASGVHYIAMELVTGETLRRRILAGVARDDAIDWIAQAADALARAHGGGIVHRDLKPENIMVTPDGYVKVLDFGLAKRAPTLDACALTHEGGSVPGLVVGTVGYMSPEQATGLLVDHRSDVFSLGCVLHELLAGAPPFAGKSALDAQHRLVYGDPEPLPSGIDPAVRKIVDRCLLKDPARRYSSMRELAQDLRAVSAVAADAPAAAARERSIAVLPFADLSPGRDSGYLGAGVAEEIITDLSSIDGLQVVARASAAVFAGTDQPIPQIARTLGVEYVVTGGVRQAGERLRITAQLLHAPRDLTVWAQKFDGTMDDIFDIQETVARAIAAQLRLQLSSSASGRLKARPIENVRAYECYLRARNHLYIFTSEALNASLSEIDRALELAGPNALLYATKGMIYWNYINAGLSTDPAMLDRAEALASDALALDPTSARAETVRGLVSVHRGRPIDAIRHLRTAVQRDPGDPDAMGWLALLYLAIGRDSQAGPLLERVGALDPLGWLSRISRPLMAMTEGRFDEALTFMAQIEERAPFETMFRTLLLFLAKRPAEAEAVADELLLRAPNDPFARFAGMFRYASAGDRAKVEELLTDGVAAVARNDLQYSAWMADVFAILGDAATAAEWLRHAMSRGYLAYPYTSRHDWFLDRVRDAASFRAVLEEMRRQWELSLQTRV